MQLKQLKLAGFKSFVDPTILAFPGPLVAVVGPNGCGKSNIIDAIRWVMGESSAKNLRGDSMTDVIFNGSSMRKALGQASVELIFDNSLGRIAGPFASYGEIAVKRVLTRDGESLYYLNGSRCRRRDVMDLFLGTGAGVRGYSIISQGDISRLIEARPETLRGYLEEAAGISKYKERRRETLTRIQHTGENLLRVADIRDELAKQQQRLEKQGKAAERYLQLKEEERLCRAEILALKWRDLGKERAQKQSILQNLAQTHTAEQVQAINWQTAKDLLQVKRQQLEQQSEDIQKTFYLSGTAITRLQEGIGQFQRENARLANEKHQLHADYEKASLQIRQYQSTLETAGFQIKTFEDHILRSGTEMQTCDSALSAEIQKQTAMDQEYAILQTRSNNAKREAQIAEVNWNNNEQQYQQTLVRLEKLAMDTAAMDIEALEQEASIFAKEGNTLAAEKMQADAQLQLALENIALLRADLTLTEKKLRETQDQHHQTKTRHAALSAAQGAALQPAKTYPVKEWLDQPRLVDKIQVEEQWQFAFEFVAGDQLKALVLEDSNAFLANISILADVGENMVTFARTAKSNASRLSDKIRGEKPLLAVNPDAIYTAENLDAAIDRRKHLEAGESVITPEGYWLGQGWIRVPKRHPQDHAGLLARQQKITELQSCLEVEQKDMENLRQQRDKASAQLQIDEKAVQVLQKNRQALFEALRSQETRQAINAERLHLAKARQQLLEEEIRELQENLESLILKKQTLMASKAGFATEWQSLEQEQQQLYAQKKDLLAHVQDLKRQLEDIKAELQQNTLEQDRALNRIKQAREGLASEQERLDTFEIRIENVTELAERTQQQYTACQQQLAEALQEHQTLEKQLNLVREQLNQEKEALDNMETAARQQQAALKALEENISKVRLEEQALALRIQALEESLQEYSFAPADLLMNLADNLVSDLRERALSVIMENITKLGAINLAAIEEYAETRARRENLDAQYADLQEALSMLEAAIEQMDKETQLRLANTFDEVNTLFKALFPRLFGGGKASLELTSSNLLEAGVVVMAQPPGKRNSSIQLLSGGEKAMTALALVFAIFQRNPSPFCMLDEVDAPLDDVNVTRFCNVVKDMSRFVQFLFITHNKVTMEMAEQLIGVTMREPGVSRLVTVDMIALEKTILE